MGDELSEVDVRCSGGEVAFDQIRRSRGTVAACGPHPFSAASDALDVEGVHESGNLVAADVMAGTLGCDPEYAGPMDAVIGDEQRHQNRHHHRVVPPLIRTLW